LCIFKGRPDASSSLDLIGVLAFIINTCSVYVVLHCVVYMPHKVNVKVKLITYELLIST